MVDGSVFALLLRLVVSLAIVIALMMFLAAALRKRGIVLGAGGASGTSARRRGGATVQVDVLARRALGRNAQVAVVRTAGRTLVLGVTDHQVTMLLEAGIDDGEVDGLEVLSEGAQGTGYPGAGYENRSGSAWKAMLETFRERTVRR
jgi:flagellar biogenesis protein FliO